MMHVLKLPGLKPVKINDTNFTPSALNNPLRNKIIQSTVQGRPADILSLIHIFKLVKPNLSCRKLK